MHLPLYHHLKRYIEIDPIKGEKISAYFQSLQTDKKEVLLAAGSRCDKLFFVLNGCLHACFIDDNGTEKTVQFALEGWWITDFLAFHQKALSNYTIQAVEASEVLMITHERQKQLLMDHPLMERYFRKVFEIGYGAALHRIQLMFNSSKEEIFYQFRAQYPEFVNRVPQYLLASFLGLTPEYLSKLRSRSNP